MKYIIILVLWCLLLIQAGYSQVSAGRNYVHKSDIKKPGVASQAMVNTLSFPADRLQQVSYFDGLGRPIQNVTIKGSQGTKDIVVPLEYDNYGRETKKFLPYVDDSVTYGSLRTAAVTNQAWYYNAANTGSDAPKDINPYSQSLLEFSPLSRPREAGNVGATWQPGSGHAVKTMHLLNTVTDSVRIWTVTDVTNSFGSYSTTAIYPATELSKSITVDEQGKQMVEFQDKEGKTILKKIELAAPADNGSGSGHYGWLCTYYVYDDQNQLRGVIQPRGVEHLLGAGWSGTMMTNIVTGFCFRYEYDTRGRMVRKSVPDAGETRMVYDDRDRLVLSQTAQLRSTKQWLCTTYDVLNRPYQTWLITDNTNYENLSYHSNLANASTGYPNLNDYSTKEELSTTFYDNYDWRSTYGNPLSNLYSNSYDSYFLSISNTTWPYAQANVQSFLTTGLVTGVRTKLIGSSNTYFYTINIYDGKGRMIQVQATNITGGMDYTTTQYSWNGQPLVVVQRIRKGSTPNPQTHVVATIMTYDELGRLLNVKKDHHLFLNNTNAHIYKPEQIIVQNEYDGLGQLKNKKLGAVSATIESVAYDYNIRGWMLGANRTYAKDASSAANYFGFDLGYDNANLTINNTAANYAYTQFNGNIAGMLWKSKGDAQIRRYDFTYDAANRLSAADFNQFSSDSFNRNAGLDFSTWNSYDANGNITYMKQCGWTGSASATIDSLTYNYKVYSNQLQNVIDGVNNPQTKLGDFRASALYTANLPSGKTSTTNDYSYNLNGSLTKDLNKDIGSASNTGITYNHLELPSQVNVYTAAGILKGTIVYNYDAAGNKLRKIVTETGQPTKTTLYLSGMVFENDTMQFISQEEGRLRYAKRRFMNGDSAYQLIYDYFLKDHLGNVRMVLTEQQDTTQYMATMEAAYRAKENKLFYNIPLTSYPKASVPGGYPTDNTTSPNDSLARVNGSGNKVGPALVLKVMSGDKVDIAVKSFYKSGGTAGSNNSPVPDILSSLASGIVGNVGESKGALSALNNGTNSPLLGAINSFRSDKNPDQSSKPKAYFNWLLLDEQFNYVAASSGAAPVGSADALNTLANTGIPIAKNGFLYIYVSNETQNWDVFFDNLAVQHYTGPITEETHYYPFGLTMAGISSKSLNKNYVANKYNFIGKELQTKEFSDGTGLEWYDLAFRIHDPQVGRFLQIDPLSDKYVYNTPYAYAENKVINGIDLEGLEWFGLPLIGNSTSFFRGPIIENIVKPLAEISEKTVEGGGKAGETGNKVPKIEDHHKIPGEFKDDPVVQTGRDGGFKFEGAENKMPIEKFARSSGQGRHGNHPKYNNEFARRLANFKENNPSPTPQQAADFLRAMAKDFAETIKNNPKTKINDLFGSALPAQAKDGIIQGIPAPGTIKSVKKEEPPCTTCAPACSTCL
jgi:RHS repeat-associated protein